MSEKREKECIACGETIPLQAKICKLGSGEQQSLLSCFLLSLNAHCKVSHWDSIIYDKVKL